MTMDRRSLLAAGGAGAVALASGLAGCGPNAGGSGGRASGTKGGLRVAWYGGQPVHEGIEKALDAYGDGTSDGGGESSKAQITTEKNGFDDYWDKLSTEFAAKDGPDVMRMSMTWLSEYAERGTLLALDDLVGETIDVSDLDDDVAASGVVDGTRYGVGQSSITQACFRNPGLVKDLGGTLPRSWDWDDFTSFCIDISGERKDLFGSTDIGGDFQMFEVWARSHGTELFDGQTLAVGADVVEEWVAMWEDLRQKKAVPSADVTAEGGSFEDSPFAKLKTAVAFGWVQQVAFYQDAMPEAPLDVADVPGRKAGDISGQFLQALDFWSLAGTTQQADQAAELVDFLLNDNTAVTAIGTSLGVPPSQSSRDVLDADPDSAEGKAVAYVESVTGRTGKNPEPWPRGYGQIQSDLFSRLNQDVGFGKVSVSDGVEAFMKDAASALAG